MIKCNCNENCYLSLKNLNEKKESLKGCPDCENIILKKFKPLSDEIDLNEINYDFKRCSCGKRPIDPIMAHVLKIMIDFKIVNDKGTLRRNGVIPLTNPFFTSGKPMFFGKDSIIILHEDMTKECGLKIMEEVSEVKGVLKGNPKEIVGVLEKESPPKIYEIIGGCDIRGDIVKTPINEIVINKKQSQNHIEFSSRIESKINKLYEYYENNNYSKDFTVIDGTCGCGSLGIFSLFYGANVIFNDIWKSSIDMTRNNLITNNFKVEKSEKKDLLYEGSKIKLYNMAFEDLVNKINEKVDLIILDPFPNTDTSKLIEKAKELTDEILII